MCKQEGRDWEIVHEVCNMSGVAAVCVGEESEVAADGDYASEGSEADDEATLEEEDALAAQDGTDRAVGA